MRDFLGWTILIVGLTAVIASFAPEKKYAHNDQLTAKTPSIAPRPALKEGKIKLAGMKTALPVNQLLQLGNSKANKVDSLNFISKKNQGVVTGTAAGTDLNHHIFNYFLEGYAPFEASNIWIPLLTLAQRKTYQLDHLQYNGKREIWQTSREAFDLTRGDCEDHAIALADWLIEMGEDAKVVIGQFKSSGHAWVILNHNNETFLLEATNKSKRTRFSYPLAHLKTDYQPYAMFNRDGFWVNTGSTNTTDYNDMSRWELRSEYFRG